MVESHCHSKSQLSLDCCCLGTEDEKQNKDFVTTYVILLRREKCLGGNTLKIENCMKFKYPIWAEKA